MDFNNADRQRATGELIPENTIVPVHMVVRPGGAGDGGWLKRNQAGNCLMIDCEFTVIEGNYARRKFWTLLTTEGETEGQQTAADITRSRLRAILESARGITPDDESEQAMNARRVSGIGDFDGLRFWAVVGLEPAKGEYKAKNVLKAVITPDRKEWAKLEQVGRPASAAPAKTSTAAKAPSGGAKPSWAA